MKKEKTKDLLSISLIRFLTRIIFVWFLKEKKLIPDELFDEKKLSVLLKDFSKKTYKKTKYYTSILQNLFFATLNTSRNEDDKDIMTRKFRTN